MARRKNLKPLTFRLYDPVTKTLSEIPSNQMPAGMVRAEVEGIEGPVWMRPLELEPARHLHPQLPDEDRQSLVTIRDNLADVFPQSLEEWEDGFRKDLNPGKQIQVWLDIAVIYREITTRNPLDPGQKRDVLKLLIACSIMPRNKVLRSVALESLTAKEAERILSLV